jgi:hypothetical protein
LKSLVKKWVWNILLIKVFLQICPQFAFNMRKILIIFFAHLICNFPLHSQHNMLGKSQKYIRSFYNLSDEYVLKVDTISKNSLLLSYKPEKQYPFYTYEINLADDECVSYGIVSKDSNVLKAYLEMLDFIGELVETDSTYNNFTYKVATDQKICFFSIKQPYFNSQFLTRRSLFYILITEQPIGNDKGKHRLNP